MFRFASSCTANVNRILHSMIHYFFPSGARHFASRLSYFFRDLAFDHSQFNDFATQWALKVLLCKRGAHPAKGLDSALSLETLTIKNSLVKLAIVRITWSVYGVRWRLKKVHITTEKSLPWIARIDVYGYVPVSNYRPVGNCWETS